MPWPWPSRQSRSRSDETGSSPSSAFHQQIAALEQDLAGLGARRLEDRAGQRRLSGAGLADEPERLALLQGEGNVRYGLHDAAPYTGLATDSDLLKPPETRVDPYETLTSREREVLQLVAEGHSNQHISQRLSISPRTVEVHRANLMRKLALQSQTDLIRYALRRGIIY